MAKPQATNLDRYLGGRLQKLRQHSGLSAAALAEAIGSTQQQISRYENGQNKLGAAQLHRLARYLGAPISWFFQDFEDEAPDYSAAPPLHISELTPSYESAQINEELAMLQSLWPRLNKAQRAAVLRLLDSFLV